MGLLGMVEATIEDLAFTIRSPRESDEIGLEDCLSKGKVIESYPTARLLTIKDLDSIIGVCVKISRVL